VTSPGASTSPSPAPNPSRKPRRRAWFGWRRLIIAVLIVGYLAFLAILPNAPTLAVVHARTEQVSFEVIVPEMTRFRMSGLGVLGETPFVAGGAAPRRTGGRGVAMQEVGPRKSLCVGGLLQATAGTRVTYRRIANGPLRITLDRADGKPVAEARGQDGPVSAELLKAGWLMIQENADCRGEPPRRFPISGIAEIGDELRPETSMEEVSSAPLIEGRVEIYGKTVDLGLLTWDDRSRIYPVTEISLPPGSRIAEADSVPPGRSRKVWSGMASVHPDEDAIQVEATTEAEALAIFRPGAGVAAEILRIGMFAQLTNDPNIVFLQIVAAVLLSLTQIFASGSQPAQRRDDP
jgi:hypothetical protein